jgi:hypothetical protein
MEDSPFCLKNSWTAVRQRRMQRPSHTRSAAMARQRSLACLTGLTLFLLVLIGACVEAARVPATSSFEDWNDERLEAALFEKSSGPTAAPSTAEPSQASASTVSGAHDAPIETATITLTRRGATLLESGAAPTAAATAAPTHAATPTPTAASTHAAPAAASKPAPTAAVSTAASKPAPTAAGSTAAPTVAATKAPSHGVAAAGPTKSKAQGTHECVVPTDRVSTFAAFHFSVLNSFISISINFFN